MIWFVKNENKKNNNNNNFFRQTHYRLIIIHIINNISIDLGFSYFSNNFLFKFYSRASLLQPEKGMPIDNSVKFRAKKNMLDMPTDIAILPI